MELVLLRNECVTHGVKTVPDQVVAEIVDQVLLPLLRPIGETGA